MHDRFDELFDNNATTPVDKTWSDENKVFMKEFFEEIEVLQHDLSQLDINVNKINNIIDEIVLSENNKKLNENIDQVNFSIKRFAEK